MISKILVSKNSVAIYWMFMVLSRLMESKAHKLQCRQLLLSNSLFMMTLLSMLDEDSHVSPTSNCIKQQDKALISIVDVISRRRSLSSLTCRQ